MQQPSFPSSPESPFIELQSVDSTNNYARQLIHAGLAQHGTAIFAHEQVAGKGQRGKAWTSEKDQNIALSIVLNPLPLPPARQFQLSASVSAGVHDFFSKYAGENTKIKWPNDLYWQDRKAGGILIESIIGSGEAKTGLWEWAIIGVGININQTTFPPHLPNPVSLKQITGKNFETILLAKELYNYIEKKIRVLIQKGFDGIYDQYQENLYKKNEKVRFKKENRAFEAIVKKVTPTGQLVVQHSIDEEFNFGEVEWVV